MGLSTSLAAPVTVRDTNASADQPALEGCSFDVVVGSPVLCSVPDQEAALWKMRRALRR